jgi:hypothetical protein
MEQKRKTKKYMKKSPDHFSPETLSRIAVLSCLIVLLLITIAACGGPNFNKNNATGSTENTMPKMTDLERDIKSMQTANFEYIYVFKRKDGGIFDAEDKTYLRNNIPGEVNRRIMSDEDKAFIAGSNYPFPEESMKSLKERFDIEDLSVSKDAEKNKNQSDNKDTQANSANK